MAKKKKKSDGREKVNLNVEGLSAEIMEVSITDTLETNYMPYAMSVIISRAIPEIDGFKPSHRKLLYTMYKMGLLTGHRTKSANIVGQTMRLNPHGDMAIYETMVRLSKGNDALLTPFVDSKGNFGKVYSRDMAFAASRYTEAKLAPVCQELFRDIDRDTVDFVDNYDNTMKEPSLIPTAFPNILASANTGIAVGMASSICGFNLTEVCETTIEFLKNPNHDIMSTLLAPDFSTGAELIYNVDEIGEIYRTGRGSFKLRAKWRYVPKENLIEVYEIPYSTTVEAVIDKAADAIKSGKIREVSDMRDETGLSGLKICIDLKRGADPDKLMAKMFRLTPLMDSFSCNFNILISGMPRVMGVREILEEWSAWRVECIKRGLFFTLGKKKDRLHLILGLQKILLDIDKAIAIIKNTENETEVVPNLMIGFGIDEIQAEYVAEIKLRNINKQYILKRGEEIGALRDEIAEIEETLNSRRRLNNVIISELKTIVKKYGSPRRTEIVYEDEIELPEDVDTTENYPVTLFLSNEGYFKKITPQSLRMSGEQKFKESDELRLSFEAENTDELIFFTNRQQVYKAFAHEFEDTKASVLGTFLPTFFEMPDGEEVIYMASAGDYSGNILFFFENGKVACISLGSYETKTRRKKLTGAYSDKSPLASLLAVYEDTEIAVYSNTNRALVFNTAVLTPKQSRAVQGVSLFSLKKNAFLAKAVPLGESSIKNAQRYRVKNIPSAGSILKEEDLGIEQTSFLE